MVVPTRLIEASIEAPAVVEVPEGSETVEVPVRTELRNDSEHDLVLHAPDEDQELFWHVLDERHREVLREVHRDTGPAPPAGALAVRSLTIAADHAEHETEILVLNARKLKDGGTYTVRAEIFGQITEAEFVAIKVPAAGAAPARAAATKRAAKKKPAAGRKAPAKKKAAARKPAPKKAAPKKAAPKKTAPRKAGGKKPAARKAAAGKKLPAGR